ncbi:MAG: sulfatase-like hydrolase/transferase [bacterium]|nr:sulfatase-like hydrolase/transferase [bacterium]
MKSEYIKSKRGIVFLLAFLAALLSLSMVNCGKAQKEKIQVIFISIDTLRGDHLSSYGYERETSPNLSRLVDGSTYFPEAYANGSWTYPSHISMLTGTLPSRHGVNQDWNTMKNKKTVRKPGDAIKNIAQVFKRHHPELKTIKFARLPDEVGFSQGFDLNKKGDPFHNDVVFEKMTAELENNKDRNFFMFLHTWMVHTPYANTYFLEKDRLNEKNRRFIDEFRQPGPIGKDGKRVKKNQAEKFYVNFLKKQGLFNLRDCKTLYDGGIRYVDHYIGKLTEKVKQLGIYDNLMIIVTSDHGEHFGEHSKNMFWGMHGNDFFEEYIKVPLVVKYPRQRENKTLRHPVSLIDVMPTVLEQYRLEVPGYVQGESLRTPYEKRTHNYFISEATVIPGKEKKMIRVGDLKYIVDMKDVTNDARINWEGVTMRRLYNLKKDPMEKNNLYKQRKYRATGLKLEKLLKRMLKRSAKLNRSRKKTRLEDKTIDHMKSLGYL